MRDRSYPNPFLQVQNLAVALQTAVGKLQELDRLVGAPDLPVASQARAVALAGLVETPVLGDTWGRVIGWLALDVNVTGGARSDFQHEVGGPCSAKM